jgi:hypothetical protein
LFPTLLRAAFSVESKVGILLHASGHSRGLLLGERVPTNYANIDSYAGSPLCID